MKYSVWSQCGKKKRYKDEHQVRQMLKKCTRERGVRLDYYYCSYCKGYHLTSLLDPPERIYDKKTRDTSTKGKGKIRD